MTRIKIQSLISVFISSLLLSACFGSSSSIPDDKFYRLPDVAINKLSKPGLSGTLAIKRFHTNGIYTERSLIYSSFGKALQLQRYHYHHWEKSPAILLQDNLIQYFSAVGFANKIIQYSTKISADYVLSGEIIQLQRDISSKKTNSNISLIFTLMDKNNNLLFTKQYKQTVQANSNAIYDTIIAYGQALTIIYSKLTVDISRL